MDGAKCDAVLERPYRLVAIRVFSRPCSRQLSWLTVRSSALRTQAVLQKNVPVVPRASASSAKHVSMDILVAEAGGHVSRRGMGSQNLVLLQSMRVLRTVTTSSTVVLVYLKCMIPAGGVLEQFIPSA